MNRKARWLVIVVSVLLIAAMSAAIVSADAYTNSTPGSADDSSFTRTVVVSGEDAVYDLNVTLDFYRSGESDCVIAGTTDNYSHPHEMVWTLQSPAGTSVVMIPEYTFDEGDTPDPVLIVLDDEAGASLPYPVPLSGVFKPVNPLSAFDGEDANGTWTLTVEDTDMGDWTCFYSYTLDFGGGTCNTGDDRINSEACAGPVALYCAGEGLEVWDVDPDTGAGTLAFTYSGSVEVPAVNTLLMSAGDIQLWILDTGEFQVNADAGEGKTYAFIFNGCPYNGGGYNANLDPNE